MNHVSTSPTSKFRTSSSSLHISWDFHGIFHGISWISARRLWEIRFRFHFKRRVSLTDLFFGAELEAYVPVNAATKRVMDLSAAWNSLGNGEQWGTSGNWELNGTDGWWGKAGKFGEVWFFEISLNCWFLALVHGDSMRFYDSTDINRAIGLGLPSFAMKSIKRSADRPRFPA